MASLTMPVLSPLADIDGVTRQTTVLAYQFADGFTNVITPLAGTSWQVLHWGGIPYQKWIKWIMPLAALWWITGAIFVIISRRHQIGNVLISVHTYICGGRGNRLPPHNFNKGDERKRIKK